MITCIVVQEINKIGKRQKYKNEWSYGNKNYYSSQFS